MPICLCSATHVSPNVSLITRSCNFLCAHCMPLANPHAIPSHRIPSRPAQAWLRFCRDATISPPLLPRRTVVSIFNQEAVHPLRSGVGPQASGYMNQLASTAKHDAAKVLRPECLARCLQRVSDVIDDYPTKVRSQGGLHATRCRR